MESRKIWVGLGAASAIIVAIASFVSATETLGLDSYLPVTRKELVEYINAQSRTNEQNNEFWKRQYRSEQRSIVRDLKIWQDQNTQAPKDSPIPKLYEQQIDDLQQRIKELEKE